MKTALAAIVSMIRDTILAKVDQTKKTCLHLKHAKIVFFPHFTLLMWYNLSHHNQLFSESENMSKLGVYLLLCILVLSTEGRRRPGGSSGGTSRSGWSWGKRNHNR